MYNCDQYEEIYPETILYTTYERDIAERDRKIEKLEHRVFELEEQLGEYENEKNTFQNQTRICEKSN